MYSMKKISVYLSLILGICVFQTPAFAALNLTLQQGISSAVPVAVVPFGGENNTLADTVSHDLQNSGRFKSLDAGQMPAQPHDVTQVNFDAWRTAKQNDLVVGTVNSEGGKYRIHFQLLDVYKGNPPLLDQTMDVSQNNLRAAAHHISDMVYQTLTGVQGIFSTRIAYVLVQRGAGRSAKYALEVADYDGYNPRAILVSNQPVMSPAWSHDGQKIAYV
jgi:TolB protein